MIHHRGTEDTEGSRTSEDLQSRNRKSSNFVNELLISVVHQRNTVAQDHARQSRQVSDPSVSSVPLW